MSTAPLTRKQTSLLLALLLLPACRLGQGTPESASFTVATETTGRPTTAVAPAGKTVFVAWTAKTDSLTNVYLARRDAGKSDFFQPVRVNNRPGDAASHAQAPAQVVVGPHGNVYVAWITQWDVPGRAYPASNIRFARSTDGGTTFAPAITVNEDAGFPTSHHFHNLAVAPDGTIYISWLDSRARDKVLLDHPELAAARVASRHAGHGMSHGAENTEGEMHMHHAGDNLPGTQLRIARSVDGGKTFQPGIVVAEGTCQCCRTGLAVAQDGTVYIAWRHIFPGGVRDIAVARSDDRGASFSAPVRVHTDDWAIDGCPHDGPALAVGKDGSVHVTWYTGVPKRAGVYYAVSTDRGASFGDAQPLTGDQPVTQVAEARDGQGGAWVAWEDVHNKRIRMGHADETGRLVMLHDTVEPGTMPALASLDGTRALAWRDGKSVRVLITRGGTAAQ